MNSTNKAQSQLLCSTAELKSFLLAGRAVVTLKSLKTQEHYTFLIQKLSTQQHTLYVKVRWGEGYSTIGRLEFTNDWYFRNERGSKAQSARAFEWFWKGVRAELPIPGHLLEVYHEGKCGRCGRPLTHPESIKSGIGPECKQLMEGARALEEF